MSCALDVVDEHPDGLRTGAIATLMQTSKRRVQQLVVRAGVKMRVGTLMLENVDTMRDLLPPGCAIEAVIHSPGSHPGIVTCTYVVAVRSMPPSPRSTAHRQTPEGGTP